MPGSRKLSTIGSPKPVNIFYIWYAELCRRSNTNPLAVVKPAKPKNDSVLDFVSDRIKAEEWVPILNALRNDTSLHVIAIRSRIECKFLHDVDTEDKIKCMKRRFGCLWTAYLLNSLVKSLCCCITRTSVLTCLELDGLPIIAEYLKPLLDGLRKNKTIKILSLKHCPIRDVGCQQLCDYLRYMPNVEVLNLTACNLGTSSAEFLAKVIRCQQINRYCESWHSSLRYEDPEVGSMAGLKRITLNNNPHIGDEGLQLILNELDDDLWIKALDMQRCNVTENIANRLVDVVDYSRSLEIADFRNNDQLSTTTIEKIFNILKNKQRFGYESEYQWCLSATTLPNDISTYELVTPSYISSNIQKSKSAPFKQPETKAANHSDYKLRRTKTFAIMNKKPINKPTPPVNRKDVSLARKEVMDLNAQLQQEISKRLQTEKLNEKLKSQLRQIKSAGKYVNQNGKKSKDIDKLLTALQTVESEPGSALNSANREKVIEIKIPQVTEEVEQPAQISDKQANGKIPVNSSLKCKKKPVEFVFPANGSRLAQNLFENLITKNAELSDDSDSEELLSYCCEEGAERKNGRQDVSNPLPKIEEDDHEDSSNASLMRYMKEITEAPSAEKPKNGLKKHENGYKKENGRKLVPSQVQKIHAKVPPVR